jgi:serine/threonine-protein kinase RsbW
VVEHAAIFMVDEDTDAVPRMRRLVARWLRDTSLTDEERYDLLLATSEAIHNACQHTPSGRATVNLSCAQDAGDVSVSIEDDGGGFTPDARGYQMQPDLDQTHGRGLFLMHHLADDVMVTATERGTRVTLIHRGTEDR